MLSGEIHWKRTLKKGEHFTKSGKIQDYFHIKKLKKLLKWIKILLYLVIYTKYN